MQCAMIVRKKKKEGEEEREEREEGREEEREGERKGEREGERVTVSGRERVRGICTEKEAVAQA